MVGGGRCVRRKGRRCKAGFLNSLRVNIIQNAMRYRAVTASVKHMWTFAGVQGI